MSFFTSLRPNPLQIIDSDSNPLDGGNQIGQLHVTSPTDGLHVQAVHLELVIETESGIEYSVPLDKLTPQQQLRVKQLLDSAGGARNIHDEMNPVKGQPSLEALELADLARTALGHPIAFQKGHQFFIANGSFLRNYHVDDKFRDHAISSKSHTHEEKLLIHNQYNCGKRLLELTRKKLKSQKNKLQQQLDANIRAPLAIKAQLKRRIEQLHKTIEFYDISNRRNLSPIKENAILTCALFPLDLSGKTESQVKDALALQTNRIKQALDNHVVHGRIPFISDRTNANNPNYEPRDEREGIFNITPFLCSSTSGFDIARQAFAADIAEASLQRIIQVHSPHTQHVSGKNPSPESFYIEIQRLLANNASDEEIAQAITGSDSHIFNAFQWLDPQDRDQMAEGIHEAALAIRNIANKVRADFRRLQSKQNDTDLREAFDRAFNTAFDARVDIRN